MKKLSFLLAAILLLFSCGSKAQTNADVAEKFITALGQEHYDEAISYFDTSSKKLNAEALQSGWKQIKGLFGNYQSHTVQPGSGQNANTAIVTIQFEKQRQPFVCTFNSDHRLTGFLMAPMKPKTEEMQATPAAAFPEEEVSIPVTGGTLKGTLMKPKDYVAGKTPVAMILAGSGATDRNCNNGSTLHTNAYLMLAEKLAGNGIASLRYDKRLIGKSMDFPQDESILRFDDYVNDAVQAVSFLKSKGSFTKIYIIGHSEGALIGMLAAARVKADAYVSLCGAGENIANTLKRQMANPEADKIIDMLKSGSLTNEVPEALQVTFRASVQPYLISWMRYEPAKEIALLKMPVLIIGGTTDLQVPVADAEMLKKAAPAAQLLVISGMNHILKDAPADRTANLVTYTQETLPLNTELVAGLLRFLAQK